MIRGAIFASAPSSDALHDRYRQEASGRSPRGPTCFDRLLVEKSPDVGRIQFKPPQLPRPI